MLPTATNFLTNNKGRKIICLCISIALIISFSENTVNIQQIAEDFLPRQLSQYLGNGKCLWKPPSYDVPNNITFTKTLVAGYPSGDKRMAFSQMEALTGLSARDEWDFVYKGSTNQPFIKANYPHHEGLWGWGDAADQVVLVIRDMRQSMVEYHDILWDIGFAKTYDEASQKGNHLYEEEPPLEDFIAWRDERVMDEIHWYGWHIDYFMEGGLMRDMYNHKITTPEHWYMLMNPTKYAKEEIAYDIIVGKDTFVAPSYDPHCLNDVTTGCEPIEIISADRLENTKTGTAETRKIANILVKARSGLKDYIIEEDAWDCIWDELLVKKKGLKVYSDRSSNEDQRKYDFSLEMLEEMKKELNRLIIKYGGPAWSFKPTANVLVDLLSEHLDEIELEIAEVKAGQRS